MKIGETQISISSHIVNLRIKLSSKGYTTSINAIAVRQLLNRTRIIDKI